MDLLSSAVFSPRFFPSELYPSVPLPSQMHEIGPLERGHPAFTHDSWMNPVEEPSNLI